MAAAGGGAAEDERRVRPRVAAEDAEPGALQDFPLEVVQQISEYDTSLHRNYVMRLAPANPYRNAYLVKHLRTLPELLRGQCWDKFEFFI